ncbi:uncharacterized protein N7479_009018 [Penicillium vulpinum]|uniref:uncharacterized protein n=1 Tax=Penicillium vulpinum TaxID=29845 RepID=UPI002549BE15|nr:uncharacterized protein N7479_009018 [Penicillium vulpinum]KAJ5950605.1 hypothetical protein N7479_009018 [Penicillium vulpinum]
MFFFETAVGTGTGMLRLTQAENGVWKAYTVYTSLQELSSSREPLGKRRAEGTTESMPGDLAGGTRIERRSRQKNFLDKEPATLVIGAGQAGLNMGARLQSPGISYLITDQNERVGDNRRNRYWTVVLARGDGSQRTVRPRHLVWCTGHSGKARIPSFPGQEYFLGSVYHSSQHRDASESEIRGKKVVVVGSGNSGHDIAQNFYENDADVTLLQRSGTYVITAEKGIFMMHSGLHEDGGPPTEQCDNVSESLPWPVQLELSVHMTKTIADVEKETLDGLRRVGFELDFGQDGAGLTRAYFTRGGGYYIDVGCSQLIIDG